MSLAGETPVRSAYGVKLLPNPTDATNVLAMIGGALDNVADLVSTTAPGMAFIDIGANNGVFSMMAAQRAGENGCVISFEPNPEVFRYLVANASLNNSPNLFPFMAAIGVSTAAVSFEQSDRTNTGMGRLSSGSGKTVLQMGGDDVCAIILPLIDQRRTLIKIDVEGAEVIVLNAIKPILQRSATERIIVEIDAGNLARFGNATSQVYNVMQSLGFSHSLGPDFSPHYDEVFSR
jgi:FkbM family methyltransferase